MRAAKRIRKGTGSKECTEKRLTLVFLRIRHEYALERQQRFVSRIELFVVGEDQVNELVAVDQINVVLNWRKALQDR